MAIGQKAIAGAAMCAVLGVPLVVGIDKGTELVTHVFEAFQKVGGTVGDNPPSETTGTTVPGS